MSDNPLVSIIINNYNYGKYVENAIHSALVQTYDRVETIVVDDGSTDHSREIVSKYKEKVKIIYKENGGQASACNTGFRHCNGDIIFFLDADDFYYPEMVEKVVKLWHPEIAKIHFRLDKLNGNLKKIGIIPSHKRSLTNGDAWKEIFLCGNVVSPPMSGNAFSKTALEKLMPIPEENYTYSADSYILKRIPFFGKYEMIDEALGVYRIHGKNYSLKINYDNYYEMILRINHAYEAYPFFQMQAKKRRIYINRDFLFKNIILLRYRILSLRIEPSKHLFQEDTYTKLLALTVRNCLFHKRYGFPRRLYELVLTLWMFVRPVKKARESMLANKWSL